MQRTERPSGRRRQPFSGTFTSPNGQYSISVTDAGINITGTAGAHILLHNNDLSVRSGTLTVDADTDIQVRGGIGLSMQAGLDITVRASRNLAVQAGANTSIDSGATTSIGGNVTKVNGASQTNINGGITTIQGGVITLNGGGGCQPAARLGDLVIGVAVGNPGAVTSNVAGGSATVCIGG